MTVNVQEAREMAALIDPLTRQLGSQLLGTMVRGQPREPAPQRLHFWRPVEPQQPAERRRICSLSCSGRWMRSSAMNRNVSKVVRGP